MIARLDTREPSFSADLAALVDAGEADQEEVASTVAGILRDVQRRGDEAVLEYTGRFDDVHADTISELEISREDLQRAFDALEPAVRTALERASHRIRMYHERQKEALGSRDWGFTDDEGNRLGQRVRGMSRIGVYAPGGKAAYPSTVLMTVIPASVAGVGEILLTVPSPGGQRNETLLAAAHLAGVDRVLSIGGAQAIAAMAYGTASINRVDKIVGPGNIYVAMAKKQVFGVVGIDMIAGPSEIVIVADDSMDVDWIVMDMMAQAEHDEMARAILISCDDAVLDAVESRLPGSVSGQARRHIIEKSIRDRGALIRVRNVDEAVNIVNTLAPEHLELAVRDPEAMLEGIEFAGAVFLGRHGGEVVGDYTAGPSHVLPTGGTARFASPLGVPDFQIRSSIIHCSPSGAADLNRDAVVLATEEGLSAHAESAGYRLKG